MAGKKSKYMAGGGKSSKYKAGGGKTTKGKAIGGRIDRSSPARGGDRTGRNMTFSPTKADNRGLKTGGMTERGKEAKVQTYKEYVQKMFGGGLTGTKGRAMGGRQDKRP